MDTAYYRSDMGTAGDCKGKKSTVGFYRYIHPETDLKDSEQTAQSILEDMAEKIQTTPANDNYTAILIHYKKSQEDNKK